MGKMTSTEIINAISIIKSRKAILLPNIKTLQTELSEPQANLRWTDKSHKLWKWVNDMNNSYDMDFIKKRLAMMYSTMDEIIMNETDRDRDIIKLHAMQAELCGLNEQEKRLAVLYKHTVDHMILQKLRLKVGQDAFNQCLLESQQVVSSLNQVNKVI